MIEEIEILIVIGVVLLLAIFIVLSVLAYNVAKIKKFHFFTRSTVYWWNIYRKHIYFGNHSEALKALKEVVWNKSEEQRINQLSRDEMDRQYKIWKEYYSPLFEQCGGKFPERLEFDDKIKRSDD